MDWFYIVYAYFALTFVACLTLGFEGLLSWIVSTALSVAAYKGHLHNPPIRRGEALFWTWIWWPGGLWKFIIYKGWK